uniref:Mitochondrial carrier protein MTM1 n=1 Tax=Ananas comosus var. bracteatus TaxID=296719 RepID=A0A6V7QYK6_ANACO
MSAASRVDFDNLPRPAPGGDAAAPPPPQSPGRGSAADAELGFAERALSAAGAAFLSAIIVNPLDVAKTRLQAQAAGFRIITPRSINVDEWRPSGRAKCFQISDVHQHVLAVNFGRLFKVVRQEGFARLWRGTNAGLALAIPTVGIYLPCYDIFRNWIEDFTTCNAPSLTPYAPLVAGSVARSLACIACSPIELARTRMQAYKEFQTGVKAPGMWKTLLGVLSPLKNTSQTIQNYRILWTGVGAQLARDVPFSAICWGTLEPTRRKLLALVGTLAAAATCPLDVAKTRRQIEKDPEKAMKMTTRQTLLDIWRSGGVKGLFTGVGPRVGRAGPSVGIVVSFYEVVKYVLHQRNTS